MFLQGQKVGKYEIIRSLGQRRIRLGLPGQGHLARHQGRDQGAPQAVAGAVQAPQGAPAPGRPQPSEHRPDARRRKRSTRSSSWSWSTFGARPSSGSCRRRRSLESSTAIDIIKQLAAGVEHAHKNKIIHRDLRPSNIIVSEEGTVKITDFGTSAWLQNVPYATTRIGSPPYMAPEQFQGKATFRLRHLFDRLHPLRDDDRPAADLSTRIPSRSWRRPRRARSPRPGLKNCPDPQGARRDHHDAAWRPRSRSASSARSRSSRPSPRSGAKKPATNEIDDILGRIRAREPATADDLLELPPPSPASGQNLPVLRGIG